MIIFSDKECNEWAIRYHIKLNDLGRPLPCNNAPYRLQVKFPKIFSKMLWLARQIESAVDLDSQCLVWITETGIFTSAENLQLFYRYRQSYGNNKLLAEAPGHLCLSFERAEVVSLLWLCMLQGWDAHVFSDLDSTSVFISHDEWFELGYTDLGACKDRYKQFEEAKLEVQLKS